MGWEMEEAISPGICQGFTQEVILEQWRNWRLSGREPWFYQPVLVPFFSSYSCRLVRHELRIKLTLAMFPGDKPGAMKKGKEANDANNGRSEALSFGFPG